MKSCTAKIEKVVQIFFQPLALARASRSQALAAAWMYTLDQILKSCTAEIEKVVQIFFQPLALARASRSQALAAGVDISKHYSPDISFTIRVIFFSHFFFFSYFHFFEYVYVLLTSHFVSSLPNLFHASHANMRIMQHAHAVIILVIAHSVVVLR